MRKPKPNALIAGHAPIISETPMAPSSTSTNTAAAKVTLWKIDIGAAQAAERLLPLRPMRHVSLLVTDVMDHRLRNKTSERRPMDRAALAIATVLHQRLAVGADDLCPFAS